MRNTTSRLAIAAALACGVIGPALADVTVVVEVSKDKDISVTETISKDKVVDVDIFVDRLGDGAAEAQALANIDNQDQVILLNGVIYTSLLPDSVNDNIGLTQYNEAAGVLQNQANLAAAALTNTGDAFANAQAEVEQVNGGTEVVVTPQGPVIVNHGNSSAASNSSFTATMFDPLGPLDGSVKRNLGMTQVNQDAGIANNQTNAIAIAIGVDPVPGTLVALAESALGQTSSNNTINDTNNQRKATIAGSIINNKGITHVNQSVGTFADQANVVSVGTAVVLF